MRKLNALFAGAMLVAPMVVCLYAYADMMNGTGSDVIGNRSQASSFSSWSSSANRTAKTYRDSQRNDRTGRGIPEDSAPAGSHSSDITTGSPHDSGAGSQNIVNDSMPGSGALGGTSTGQTGHGGASTSGR